MIDGGSRDNSVEIIRSYEAKLAYWQTGKDRNSWDAINQGWGKATGQIFCYLNADDVFAGNAIQMIVDAFVRNPDADVIYGDAKMIDAQGNHLHDFPSRDFDLSTVFSTWEDPIRQPSAFFRAAVYHRYGGMDETYRFCSDFEYWIRIASGVKFLHIPVCLSLVRLHPETKTSTMEDVQAKELIRLCRTTIHTQIFRDSGVTPHEALGGVHFLASLHFRNAGRKWEALRSYLQYCRYSLSPLQAIYRCCRYCASLLLR